MCPLRPSLQVAESGLEPTPKPASFQPLPTVVEVTRSAIWAALSSGNLISYSNNLERKVPWSSLFLDGEAEALSYMAPYQLLWYVKLKVLPFFHNGPFVRQQSP